MGFFGDADDCHEAVYGSLTIKVLLIYSIVVFVLYSLLQRRKALCQNCCFGGHCGLPVPINFINETKDRWVYCAAFGMLVNLFLFVIVNVSAGTSNSLSAALSTAFTLFISMMILTLYNFALIASIHGPMEPLSHLIGLIHAVVSFVAYMRPCGACMHNAKSEPRGIEFLGTATALQIVTCTPLLLCNGIVIVYFAVKGTYVLILRLLKKPLPKQENIDHCLGYVRRLLCGPQTDSRNSVIYKYCYKWDPYFKYSVRLLSVFTVIFIALFVWSLQVAYGIAFAIYALKKLAITQDIYKIKWTNILEIVYKALLVIGFTVPLISFALVIIPLIISLTTYRHNCKQLWKGDRSFIPQQKRRSPTVLLTSSAFLFGRQLAMAIWAWILYIVTLLIMAVLLVVLILLVVFVHVVRAFIIKIICSLLLTFGVSAAIYYCQMLFVHLVFADRSVLVNNRRLFHLYTYFFLFYNSISGITTTVSRILASFATALFFLPRLDRPLVIGGLEFLDKGYTSYLAYIQVEAAYTNPILNVFIHLLMNEVKLLRKPIHASHSINAVNLESPLLTKASVIVSPNGQQYGSTPLMGGDDFPGDVIGNKVAKKRWHLLYTLVRNPELIKLRKGFDAAAASSSNNK